jgi:hypothetical protein
MTSLSRILRGFQVIGLFVGIAAAVLVLAIVLRKMAEWW